MSAKLSIGINTEILCDLSYVPLTLNSYVLFSYFALSVIVSPVFTLYLSAYDSEIYTSFFSDEAKSLILTYLLPSSIPYTDTSSSILSLFLTRDVMSNFSASLLSVVTTFPLSSTYDLRTY